MRTFLENNGTIKKKNEMFANVMIAFKDIMLKIQGREIRGEKRLSVLAQVRSKKRKLGEKRYLAK